PSLPPRSDLPTRARSCRSREPPPRNFPAPLEDWRPPAGREPPWPGHFAANRSCLSRTPRTQIEFGFAIPDGPPALSGPHVLVHLPRPPVALCPPLPALSPGGRG